MENKTMFKSFKMGKITTCIITMKNYNCYAFALSVTNSFVHPGHYNIPWTAEYYNDSFGNNGHTYDSTIYYIKYRFNHSYAGAKKLVDNYHAGRLHYYQYGYECTNCPAIGNTYWVETACSGPPCTVLYTP